MVIVLQKATSQNTTARDRITRCNNLKEFAHFWQQFFQSDLFAGLKK
jgi:hypothetical protein